MQITKEHLERVSRRLEKESLDLKMSEDEHDAFLAGCDFFKTELECIMSAKSEEHLENVDAYADKFMEIFNDGKLAFEEKRNCGRNLKIKNS